MPGRCDALQAQFQADADAAGWIQLIILLGTSCLFCLLMAVVKGSASAVPHFRSPQGEEVEVHAAPGHRPAPAGTRLVLLNDPHRSTPRDFFYDSLLLFGAVFFGIILLCGGIISAGLVYPKCNDYDGWWSCFNNCPRPSQEDLKVMVEVFMGAGITSTLLYAWGGWVRCSQAWGVPRCGDCCCTKNCCCVHRSCLWKCLWKACCVYPCARYGDLGSRASYAQYEELNSQAQCAKMPIQESFGGTCCHHGMNTTVLIPVCEPIVMSFANGSPAVTFQRCFRFLRSNCARHSQGCTTELRTNDGSAAKRPLVELDLDIFIAA